MKINRPEIIAIHDDSPRIGYFGRCWIYKESVYYKGWKEDSHKWKQKSNRVDHEDK